MSKMNQTAGKSAQRGVVLVSALILLVIITLLSMSAMRVSITELRMAGNQETAITSFQASQALSDAIIDATTSTPVIGDPGFTICTGTGVNCDRENWRLPNGMYGDQLNLGVMDSVIVRLAPALRPPPRGINSSADKFSAAAFSITSTFDMADQGFGRDTVVEGVLILVPTN
ncbi:MAG: PilX N-terminal domain-containing pilus assembly protein [Gammaproteobacteria bacterium]